MPRNPAVLAQIAEVDRMLADTGVRDFCLACIRGPRGGCCQDCGLLGTEGCTNKPLSCTLWLCGEAKEAFPEVKRKLVQISLQWPVLVARSTREASLMYEESLLPSE